MLYKIYKYVRFLNKNIFMLFYYFQITVLYCFKNTKKRERKNKKVVLTTFNYCNYVLCLTVFFSCTKYKIATWKNFFNTIVRLMMLKEREREKKSFFVLIWKKGI